MLNIIQSDIYRIRKGAALRNVLIVLFLLLIFLAGTYRFMTSDGIVMMLDQAATQGMGAAELESMQAELAGINDLVPQNAAEFALSLVGDNFLVFFIFPLVLTVFCADFSAGTYRNTLSYAGGRTGVYLTKLFLSVLGVLLLIAAQTVFAWLIGGVLFGFGGFGAAYFARLGIVILLLLPVQLGVVGFGHMLIALTRKSGTTIAAFIGFMLGLSIVLQMASLLPMMGWLSLLDWNMVGKLLAQYSAMAPWQLSLAVGFHLAVAAVTTAVGISAYRRADLA